MQKGYSVSSIMDDVALRAMFKAAIKTNGGYLVKTQPFTQYFGIDAKQANSLLVTGELHTDILRNTKNEPTKKGYRHYAELHTMDFVRWVHIIPIDMVQPNMQKHFKEFQRLMLQYFYFGLQYRLFKKPKNAALLNSIEQVWRKKYGLSA